MKLLSLFAFVFALALTIVQAEDPAKITLTGTIRDFSLSHPDFEKYLGSQAGIVAKDLGVDGKPVYAAPNQAVTSGKANFDQWYRDVSGVNYPSQLSIDLINNGNGIYTYDNQQFFPIDNNEHWGNEGLNHNFAFTFEVHTVFTYQPGQVFNFIGDDDVWVFINNKLAIDLGGVHGPSPASVSLDTLGLTVGNDYNLDLFSAERHTSGSTLKIETSLKLKPAQPLCPVLPQQQAVFRWHHPASNDHFYTADPAGEVALQGGWKYETIGFYTLITPASNTNTIYRVWNGHDHLYTIDATERATLLSGGYSDEGILGYVYKAQETGTVALTRYASSTDTTHYYAKAGDTVPAGYTPQGVLGYVYPN